MRGHMELPRDRVISITLDEKEWEAFVRLHPQPVNWIRERIQESLRLPSGQTMDDAPIAAPLSATAAANRTSATTR